MRVFMRMRAVAANDSALKGLKPLSVGQGAGKKVFGGASNLTCLNEDVGFVCDQ